MQCATKCGSSGHENCPVCRHPHLLDPSKLKSRKETWRVDYNRWRRGKVHGSIGEIADISSVAGPKGANPKGVQDIVSPELLADHQSERLRALNLNMESSWRPPMAGSKPGAEAENAKTTMALYC